MLKTTDNQGKQNNRGCLVLILLAIPLANIFGMVLPYALQHHPEVMLLSGFGGFAIGAALGAYVTVRLQQRQWWLSCRWVAYGFIGMTLLPLAIFVAFLQR